MQFSYTTLLTCHESTGTVVVIDVLRAFTTAAFAFAAGAQEIILTATVEEAFRLKSQFPDALLMGEVDGLPIDGFDFGNSPTQFVSRNLDGKRLIQRTSAGTQGMIRCRRADLLLASSFVCAQATIRYLLAGNHPHITFVITGAPPDQDLTNKIPQRGDEDLACAEYLQAGLQKGPLQTKKYIQRVLDSPNGQVFADPNRPQFPHSDLMLSVEIDRFDFAMSVRRQDGLHILKKAYVQ